MKMACIAVFATTMAALSASVFAQGLPTQKVLTIEVAETIAQEAMTTCRTNGYKATVTVVDSGNRLKVFLSDDGATILSAEATPMKAKMVISTGLPTGPRANLPAGTLAPQVILPGTIDKKGGLPIKVGDQLIGAVAVGSNGGGDQDVICAKAGLAKVADKLR